VSHGEPTSAAVSFRVQDALAFDLSLAPHPRLVSDVREFVEAAMARIACDADAIFRVAMTAHELLENGIKYGTSRRVQVSVSIQRRGDGFDALVRVTNDASEDYVSRLRKGVAGVGSAADPLRFYQSLMLGQDSFDDRSGLGLARVRAEAEMSLDLHVEGRQITIEAAGRLPDVARS
jgi:hypothetical protein